MKKTKRAIAPTNDNDKKVPVQAMVHPNTAVKIQTLASAEGRSLSNMAAFLLESHPKMTEASNGQ